MSHWPCTGRARTPSSAASAVGEVDLEADQVVRVHRILEDVRRAALRVGAPAQLAGGADAGERAVARRRRARPPARRRRGRRPGHRRRARAVPNRSAERARDATLGSPERCRPGRLPRSNHYAAPEGRSGGVREVSRSALRACIAKTQLPRCSAGTSRKRSSGYGSGDAAMSKIGETVLRRTDEVALRSARRSGRNASLLQSLPPHGRFRGNRYTSHSGAAASASVAGFARARRPASARRPTRGRIEALRRA